MSADFFSEKNILWSFVIQFWQWYTSVPETEKFEFILSRTMIAVLGAVAAMFLLYQFLRVFVLIKNWGNELGIPLFKDKSYRDNIRRRSQFCRILKSDLEVIGRAESWNDQHFADLEAEVDAEGRYYKSDVFRYLKKSSSGLRRVSSLIKAIKSTDERCLLLVGDPGSGKSIALRHMAYQLAEKAVKSKSDNVSIPLYINLREMERAPGEKINANFVRAFVVDNLRRGDADTAEYLREKWNEYLRNGTWFFLFDSFDEIPEVLHASGEKDVVQEYSEAIRHFVDGMSDCRAVIASREYKGPDTLPWEKFRILPLSLRKKEELVENSYLSDSAKNLAIEHLHRTDSKLYDNPLFLTLLCRYIKDFKTTPTNDHALLARHVERLSQRDSDYIRRKYSLNPESLLSGAEALSAVIALNKDLSLSPRFEDVLPHFVSYTRRSPDECERMLQALVEVKICRTDVKRIRVSEQRIAFSHRRYQEALFVGCLSKGEMGAFDVIVRNVEWREYLVALLQMAPAEIVGRVLSDFENVMRAEVDAFNSENDPSEKDDQLTKVGDLLRVLQEGMGARSFEIPTSLSSLVDSFLEMLWASEDVIEKLFVLKHCGGAGQTTVTKLIKAGLSSSIGTFRDHSFRMSIYIRNTDEETAHKVRKKLSSELLWRDAEELIKAKSIALGLSEEMRCRIVLRRCVRLRKIFSLMEKVFFLPLNALETYLSKSSFFDLDQLFSRLTVDTKKSLALLQVAGMLSITTLTIVTMANVQNRADTGGLVVVGFLFLVALYLLVSLAFVHEPETIGLKTIIRSLGKISLRREQYVILIIGIIFVPVIALLPGGVMDAIVSYTRGYGISFEYYLPAYFLVGLVATVYMALRVRKLERELKEMYIGFGAPTTGVEVLNRASSYAEVVFWLKEKPHLFKDPHELREISKILYGSLKACLAGRHDHASLKWIGTCSIHEIGLLINRMIHRYERTKKLNNKKN